MKLHKLNQLFLLVLALGSLGLAAVPPTHYRPITRTPQEISRALSFLSSHKAAKSIEYFHHRVDESADNACLYYEGIVNRPSLQKALAANTKNPWLNHEEQRKMIALIKGEIDHLRGVESAFDDLFVCTLSVPAFASQINVLYDDLLNKRAALETSLQEFVMYKDGTYILGDYNQPIHRIFAPLPYVKSSAYSVRDPKFFISYFKDYSAPTHKIKYTSHTIKTPHDVVPLVDIIGQSYLSATRMRNGLSNADAEKIHSWVQWAFPTKAASQHNQHAPRSNKTVRAAFAQDAELRYALKCSFQFYLNFMGLYLEPRTKKIQPISKTAYINGMNNFTSNPHNFLRITRIINSLNEHSLPDLATKFYSFLTHRAEMSLPGDLTSIASWDAAYGTNFAQKINASTKKHWSRAHMT